MTHVEYYAATREDLEGLRKNMESLKVWVLDSVPGVVAA